MKPAILLVEDNKINQLVARKVLEKADLAVDVAASADEALAMLRKNRYHLVLMDVQMPGTDGAEATRRIRSGEAEVLDSDVPILAMTAYTSSEDQQKFAASGMNGYLAKPLDVDELIERVRTFTESDNSGEDPALNEKELNARTGGDRELAIEIVEGFSTTLSQRMDDLSTAIDSDDWQQVQMIAHSIAGAASNVAAPELVRFGRDLEKAARGRDVTRARLLLGRSDHIAERFRKAVVSCGFAGS